MHYTCREISNTVNHLEVLPNEMKNEMSVELVIVLVAISGPGMTFEIRCLG